jgi:hypothetical protein
VRTTSAGRSSSPRLWAAAPPLCVLGRVLSAMNSSAAGGAQRRPLPDELPAVLKVDDQAYARSRRTSQRPAHLRVHVRGLKGSGVGRVFAMTCSGPLPPSRHSCCFSISQPHLPQRTVPVGTNSSSSLPRLRGLRPQVALLHFRCSGPVHLCRFASSCPRSLQHVPRRHGTLARIRSRGDARRARRRTRVGPGPGSCRRARCSFPWPDRQRAATVTSCPTHAPNVPETGDVAMRVDGLASAANPHGCRGS